MHETVFLQHGQKETAKSDFTGGDEHRSALQVAACGYFRFARFYVLNGGLYVRIKFFSLGRQLHAAVGARKQRAAEFRLKIFYRACQVRLIAEQ